MKQTVVIGITSGIAAYKSLGLIKLLKHEGLDVAVIMTNSATKMIPLHKVEKVSGNKVFVELFEKNFNYKNILKSRKVDHIDIADKADIMVIVPATANIIAKLAHGIADDFLTTTALAVTAPILLSPSMNINMWNNPIIQENIMKLQEKGFQIIEPAEGMLACGYEGKGRLPDIQTIKDEIQRNLQYIDSLKGKKIIVTAGATIEKIDDVRYITNRSSGKMGIRIAEECYLRGAKVLLLRAKHSIKPRYLIEEEIFDSADDLAKLIEKHIRQYEVFFHVAAVSDFSVKKQPGKIKSGRSVVIRLNPRKKILDSIKKMNPKIYLVSFKAEYGLKKKELLKKALERLRESNADVIIVNDVSKKDRGFESDYNEVFIIQKDGSVKKISFARKTVVAKKIIDRLLKK